MGSLEINFKTNEPLAKPQVDTFSGKSFSKKT